MPTRKHAGSLLIAFALVAAVCLGSLAAPAVSTVPPASVPAAESSQRVEAQVWEEIHPGVAMVSLTRRAPSLQAVRAVRVDLAAPRLRLFATPGNGERPHETDGQTASAFLEEHGLLAAINTHFFAPCCEPAPGQPKDLVGLAIAQGQLVSPHDRPGSARDVMIARRVPADDAPGSTRWSVNFVADAPAVSRREPLPDWLHGVEVAMAGRLVLLDGKSLTASDRFWTERHPRSALGVSEDGRWLFLIAVDGRRPGHSVGASLDELADVALSLGAHSAMNVDGGGSTTLVIRDGEGHARVLNRPSGGRERVNGSHVGVRFDPPGAEASPSGVPESRSDPG